MGAKILIVDDDADFCSILKASLEDRGHEVSVRADPATGLTAMKGQPPKFLILDMHMPRGGGKLLYDAVRKDEKFKDLPIVVVTAGATTEEISEMVGRHPRTIVLRKPLDINQIDSLAKRHGGAAKG